MIQVNELRIGNWVFIDNGQTPKYTYELTAHDIEEIEGCGDDTFPIPLTSEILERCGFKKWGKTRDYAYKGIILHGRQRGFVLRKSVPTIQSVHQLQNLFFALTGTELQINLTTP